MANDAYRIVADTSIPKATGRLEDDVDGNPRYNHVGIAYAEGDVVLAQDISPIVRDLAEKGELEHVLEPISIDEANEILSAQGKATFIPQHEAEEFILEGAGHRVVPKDQVLELKSAGAEAAAANLEASKENDADARPNLSSAERPSLVEVSHDLSGGTNNAPNESEHVDDDALEGVEQPPGLSVGKTLAAAEGADVESERKPRSRPRRKAETTEGGEG